MAIGMFVFNFGKLSSYQQSANDILQSNGGVTAKAQKQLTTLSKNNHQLFTIQAANAQSKKAQGFGKTITYKIHCKVPLISLVSKTHGMKMNHALISTDLTSVTTSQVGKD